MKFLIILTLLTSFAHAAQSRLMARKLKGDCQALTVQLKKLNGIPSIALTQDPTMPFKALAPIGGQTVTRTCIIDMDILVPADHKIGVYDPNTATNHLHLGRFNGTQYILDQNSSFSWEMGWDLEDRANTFMQTRSSFNQGPLAANFFGGDFQAVLPHQWSACKRKPHTVNLKVEVKLTATSSRKNTAELIFRNANLKLTTKNCYELTSTRNPYPDLLKMVMGLQDDFSKFYDQGQKTSGTRVRKGMQELKNLSKEIRAQVQKMMNGQ